MKNLPELTITSKLKFRTTNKEGELDYKYSPFRNLETDKGLADFSTTKINFCTDKPLDIITQDFFDGSVNLIISDDKNQPKLINSRFAVKEDRGYYIPDHFGTKDTSLYDEKELVLDTNLYKTISKFPELEFLGTSSGGNIPCGNYHFFFKLTDNDGNSTDFVLESGLVTCFIGTFPTNIRMGLHDENSEKAVKFKLDNLDGAYNFVSVYLSRSTSGESEETKKDLYYKIEKRYPINTSGPTFITITGEEVKYDITINDINPRYFLTTSVKTIASCQNRLFLGNIETPKVDYEDLQDVSLRIKTKISMDDDIGFLDGKYIDISNSKHRNEYYNPLNIYHRLGYWPGEIYRFGVVYILEDFTFTPVFNISGGDFTTSEELGKTDDLFKDNIRKFINVNEDGFYKSGELQNSKGVIRIKETLTPIGKNIINPIGIEFKLSEELSIYLKEKHKIRGFFIVRQPRVPITLAQGVTISRTKDKFGNVPVLRGLSYGKVQGIYESFIDSKRQLKGTVNKNIPSENLENTLLIVPEYELREHVYNNMFNGTELMLSSMETANGNVSKEIVSNLHFNINRNQSYDSEKIGRAKVLGLNDSVVMAGLGNRYFTNNIGNPYEPSKVVDVIHDWTKGKELSYLDSITKWSLKGGFVNQNTVFPKMRTDLMGSTSVVRGCFGKYVAMDTNMFNFGDFVNIRTADYKQTQNYFEREFSSRASKVFPAFSAVTPWVKFLENEDSKVVAYGGDCFIGNFTHRMIRNHTDPEIPNNNKIVDVDTWVDNLLVWQLAQASTIDGHAFTRISELYNTYLKRERKNGIWGDWTQVGENDMKTGNVFDEDFEAPKKSWLSNFIEGFTNADKQAKMVTRGAKFMNRTDINSVPLGHWVTAKFMASTNISLRDIDQTYQSDWEHRTFHPYKRYNKNSTLPESDVLNSACNKSLSNKLYTTIHETPYINQHFDNYILYSEEYSSRATNGYRVFYEDSFRALPRTYGGLTKLVEMGGKLVAVMEHGIYLIDINERQTVSDQDGKSTLALGDVISKYPQTVSDSIGSTWKDSVVKTLAGIYGIDTVAKKIWRFDGKRVEILSDMSIQKFLNDNINLLEGDKEFKHEVKSIKAHYNAFKKDVMFVFSYWITDDGELDLKNPKHGKRWNLCYNELLGKWITQYTWFPEFSENINNIFYTFANNKLIDPKSENFNTGLDNRLYQHGFAGFSDVGGSIKPTMWYGKQHPFEFEFVVIGVQGVQQIFNNLKIISNLAEPDSFEFEIVGEGFDWKDKKAHILKANKLVEDTLEEKFKKYLTDTGIKKLPLLEVVDPIIFNKVWNPNPERRAETKLYEHNKTKEILIKNYQKGLDIKSSGRVKGNMQYVEDSWDVQIQPISFKEVRLDNEGGLIKSEVKEMKIRDKYIKIRVKYKGDQYAIINALRTLYTISYG